MDYMMNFRKVQQKAILIFIISCFLCLFTFVSFLKAYKTTSVPYIIVLCVTQITYFQTVLLQLSAIYAISITLNGIYFELNQLNLDAKDRSSLIYTVKQISSMYHYAYCAVQDFNCSLSLLHGLSITVVTFVVSFSAFVIARLIVSEDLEASYDLIIFFISACILLLFIIGSNCTALHDLEKEASIQQIKL